MSIHRQRCENCKFWQPYISTSAFEFDLPVTKTLKGLADIGLLTTKEVTADRNDWGSCQRRPPVVLFEKNIPFGIFPSSHKAQWCGEFEISPYAKYTVRIRQLYEDHPEWFQGIKDSRINLIIDTLHKYGVVTVANWLMYGNFQLLRTPNLGRKVLHEINQAVALYVEGEDGIKLDLF